MEKRMTVFVLMTIVLLNAFTFTSGIPLQNDEYSSEDIAEAFRMLPEIPMKRSPCVRGYSFQAITRMCVPSLGALRHRGGGRRRY